MATLAIVLYLRSHGAAYEFVGLSTAAYAIAAAAGSPMLGRWVDLRGQVAPLVVAAAGSTCGFLLLEAGGGRSLALDVGAVALAGMLTPPLEPCLRSLWPAILKDESTVAAAYALDAAVQEVIFVAGPLVVIAVVHLWGAGAALAATAVAGLMGSLLFAVAPPTRTWRPRAHRPHWLGPLRSKPLRGLLVVLLFVGTSLGVLSIIYVAYAEGRHDSSLSGVLLCAGALGGLVAGVTYGARSWPGSSGDRFPWLVTGLAVGYLPLAAAPGPVPMVALAAVAGLFLAPTLACAFVVVGEIAPEGTVTEAFSWIITVFISGTALGSLVAGVVVQRAGVGWAFTLPAAMGALALIATLLSRRR